MQTVHGNKDHIPVAVHDFYGFLHPSTNVCLHKSAKHSYSVVYVHDIVSHVISVEIFYGESFAAFHLAAELYPVIPFKNLMVRVKADLRIRTDEPFARRTFQMFKLRIFTFGYPG